MLNVVSHLLSQALQTFIPTLPGHEGGKLLVQFLQLLIFLEILELLELCLVNDVALEVLEALSNFLLHHRLVVRVAHGMIHCPLIFTCLCTGFL